MRKTSVLLAVFILELLTSLLIGLSTGLYVSASSSGDDWPMFHHDMTHSGYSASTAPNTNQTLWTYKTGGEVYSSPAVANGKVYMGSGDGVVYCLDAYMGGLIWNYTTHGGVESSPAVVEGRVFVGSNDGNVYCFDASIGSKLWNYTTGNNVASSPVVANGRVYVGSHDHNVYCFDASSGAKIWNYTTNSWVSSSPAVADGKVYVGSESNPYAVKPIASKVAQVLKLGEEDEDDVQGVDAVDTEFACKAATSVFKDAASLVNYSKSNVKNAMVIGTDNSQAAPRDSPGGELDMFVGYGAAACIFGKTDVVAEIEGWYSCTSDTPDFWRRDGEPFPMHGGRFTGDPAYFKHVRKAAKKLMERLNLRPNDIDYFVAHQPNPQFPARIAKELGFKEEQYSPSLQVIKFGNTYSAASPLGLAAVLDVAEPEKRILVASYGSGAGSDAYSLITTSQILEKRQRQKLTVKYQAENPFLEYVDYTTYRRLKLGM